MLDVSYPVIIIVENLFTKISNSDTLGSCIVYTLPGMTTLLASNTEQATVNLVGMFTGIEVTTCEASLVGLVGSE